MKMISPGIKRSLPAFILCLLFVTACSDTYDQGPPPVVSTGGGVSTGGHHGSLVSQPLTRYGGPVSVKMEVEPSAPQAGQQFTIAYTLHQGGQPLTLNKLQITHERPMHLIVVSQDLSYFSHIHPEEKGGGRYSVTATIPKAGPYLLFNEFVTEKGVVQYDRHEITLSGDGAQSEANAGTNPQPTLGHIQQVGDLSTLLTADTGTVKRRVPTTFLLDVSRGGRPVTDLEPYLAAAGHVVLISRDTTQFTHTHGEAHDPNVPHTHNTTTHPLPPVRFGPQIEFTHTFSTQPGLYKIWVQFIHSGKVVTVENTVEVVK